MNCVIIGFGSFGKAIAKIILNHQKQQKITVFDVDKQRVESQIQEHFQDDIDRISYGSTDKNDELYKQSIAQTDVVIVAVGSRFMIPVMSTVLPWMNKGSGVVNVAKALSPNGLLFAEEFIHLCDSLDIDSVYYASLAGGMAASDIMNDVKTGATIGSVHENFAKILKQYFEGPLLAIELVQDVYGVEYAGVLKNIASIQAGYLLGTFGSLADAQENIQNMVKKFTHEIRTQAEVLGIDGSTFLGTYCRDHPEFGDIKTSCFGNTRNMNLGKLWYELGSLPGAIHAFQQQGHMIEGANTLQKLSNNLEHPLIKLRLVEDLLTHFSSTS